MSSDLGVEARGLGKHFRGRVVHHALRDVSLEVRPGELLGVLGPNGAGKSTLFRVLAGVLEADAGHATVAGADLRTDPATVRRRVGVASADERSLHWRLSARENLRLFAALHGLPRAPAEARCAALLTLVRLDDSGTRLVGAFSSGMRQRLLLARALLAEPTVLLLDEPTRSLDPIGARDFRRFLHERVRGTGRQAILLATHSAEEVFELCDRVLVLERGRVVAHDTTAQLRRRTGGGTVLAVLRLPAGATLAEALAAAGLPPAEHAEPLAEGWCRVRLPLDDAPAARAAALGALHARGAAVAEWQHAALDLATLLERLLAGRPADA